MRSVLVLMLLLWALPARGQGASDDDGGGTRVAVFLVPGSETSLPPRVAARLTRALEAGLKENKRLSVADKDLLLAEFGGEVPEAQVEQARTLYGEGLAALESGDAAGAVSKLIEAEKAFEPVLAFVKKNELADTQFLLGVAYATANDRKRARATFVRLGVWRPSHTWDVEKYAAVLPLWEQAKDDLGKLGRGSLELLSEPEGALAFVDGKYVGVTPAAADGLVVGQHYVTLKLEGYQRRVIKAHVDPRYQELVTESLPRSEKYVLVEQSLTRVRGALGQDAADPAMLDLRTFLFLDMALFVRVVPRREGGYGLDAYLYDLRSKRRLAQVVNTSVAGDDEATDAAVGELVRALFVDVRYDGAGPAVVSKRKRGPAPPPPFYKKWWFWGTLVGVAAAGAGVVIFQDDLFPEDPPSCRDGEICTGVVTEF